MNAGDTVGKYRLERRIGDGAMGVVWAAVNLDTHKEVALKLLTNPSEELRRRLLREAKACGRLEHRNIVTLYDTGRTEQGEPFLVMQLLSGETLAERLERTGALPPAEAASIAAACAAGLGAAHAAGIVHRDLKPENVFLHREAGSRGDVVKILDFGVSRVRLGDGDAGATATGALIGSPAYMSPEQARGSKVLGPRADLWSLGVVLFEMLTGERPFPARNVADAITQLLVGPIPTVASRAPGVPAALSDLVAACLSRDPDQRPAGADQLAERLSAFSAGAEAVAAVARGAGPARRGGPARLPRASVPDEGEGDSDDFATNVLDARLLRHPLAPPVPGPAASPRPAAVSDPHRTLPLEPPSVDDEDTADVRATEPRLAMERRAAAAARPPLPSGPGRPDGGGLSSGDQRIPPHPPLFGVPPAVAGLSASSTTAPLAGAPATPPRSSSRPLALALGALALSATVLVLLLVSVLREPRRTTVAAGGAATALGAAASTSTPAVPPPETAAAAANTADPSTPSASAGDPPAPSANAGDPPAPPATAAPEGTGSPAERTGAPSRASSEPAWVKIQSNATARVLVDDKAVGVTPLAPVSLRPGQHKISLRHTILGERTTVVTVKPGQPLTVSVDFATGSPTVGSTRAPPASPGF